MDKETLKKAIEINTELNILTQKIKEIDVLRKVNCGNDTTIIFSLLRKNLVPQTFNEISLDLEPHEVDYYFIEPLKNLQQHLENKREHLINELEAL